MKIIPCLLGALLVAPFVTAAPPDDAQIAAIVVAANQVDIDAGRFAADRSTNPEVRSFAKTMVTDHSAVNQSATELVQRLKVTPADNPTAQALRAGGEQNLARLRGLRGAEFDRAYVEHEVAYHEQVLQAIDTTLIPSAQNAELKALLVKVRPAFVAHLNHARHLASTLR